MRLSPPPKKYRALGKTLECLLSVFGGTLENFFWGGASGYGAKRPLILEEKQNPANFSQARINLQTGKLGLGLRKTGTTFPMWQLRMKGLMVLCRCIQLQLGE